MESLNIQSETVSFFREDWDEQFFDIMRDYLQEGSAATISHVAASIISILPKDDNYQVERLILLFIEVAAQIPYYHPSQNRLIDLMTHIGKLEENNPLCKRKWHTLSFELC